MWGPNDVGFIVFVFPTPLEYFLCKDLTAHLWRIFGSVPNSVSFLEKRMISEMASYHELTSLSELLDNIS